MGRIANEKLTVSRMISLYCRKKEKQVELCDDCQALKEYALKRLDKCHFGESKPACKKCPIHCYSPAQREKIRAVMRYSGPRLFLYDPMAAIKHLLGK